MIVHTGLQAGAAIFLEGIGRHGDNGDRRCIGPIHHADPPCGFQPVHDRHHNIHQDKVELPRCGFCKNFHSLSAVSGLCRGDALIGQQCLGNFDVQLVVFHKQRFSPGQVR